MLLRLYEVEEKYTNRMQSLEVSGFLGREGSDERVCGGREPDPNILPGTRLVPLREPLLQPRGFFSGRPSLHRRSNTTAEGERRERRRGRQPHDKHFIRWRDLRVSAGQADKQKTNKQTVVHGSRLP